MILENLRDGSGVYGGIFHYALIFAIVGSSFLIFLCLWWKGRLDLDEEPKIQMMLDDDSKEGPHGPQK